MEIDETTSVERVVSDSTLAGLHTVHSLEAVREGLWRSAKPYCATNTGVRKSAIYKPTNRDGRAAVTNYLFNELYNVKALNGDKGAFVRGTGESAYHYVDEERFALLVKNTYRILFPTLVDSGSLRTAVNTVRDSIEGLIDEVPQDYIQIGDEAGENTVVYSKQEDKGRTIGEIKERNGSLPDIYIIMPGHDRNEVWGSYLSMRTYLKSGDPTLEPERLAPLMDWAVGDEDTYQDLLYAASTILMSKKPLGSYLLIGVGRNGKSSYLELLNRAFGRGNTANVTLDKLGDWHKLGSLRNALCNLCDESQDGSMTSEAISNFKVVASYGELDTDRMGSNTSERRKINFVSFFSFNMLPNFGTTSTDAVVKRLRPIYFNGDFSASDAGGHISFEDRTYTSEFLGRFVGYCMAYAEYYAHHDRPDTKTMIRARNNVAGDIASDVQWRKLLESGGVVGWQTYELARNDYANFCELNGLEPKTIDFRDPYWCNMVRRNFDDQAGRTRKGYRFKSNSKPYMNASEAITSRGGDSDPIIIWSSSDINHVHYEFNRMEKNGEYVPHSNRTAGDFIVKHKQSIAQLISETGGIMRYITEPEQLSGLDAKEAEEVFND